MKQFDVRGMHCAACSARVEKAVNAVPGVESCAVSLLTNSMGVEGGDEKAIIAAVEKAGYAANVKGAQAKQEESALRDTETPKMKKRLWWSVGFLAVLMYLSMGHMLGLPLPHVFHQYPAALALSQMILAAIVMVINQKFFISGFQGIANRAPNMDTLVALGSGAAFVYSAAVLYQMLLQPEKAPELIHGLYFESAAMILTLITVGKMLEARSKGKTTSALQSLMRLAPKTACRVVDGKEETVPVDNVRPGDLIAVRPGEQIPVDGVILEGHTAVNEAALTGESIPVDKEAGSPVSAGTMNQEGYILFRAEKVGQDTALSGIIRMVEGAAATKAPIAKIADKVSGIFVPVVIGIALITIAVWLLLGKEIGFALARGISVLVISCPCALGLATPVAIMVGSGVGAKNCILFKTAVSLEETGKSHIVVLDKTGTLTTGTPVVTDMLPLNGESEESLLSLAAALEKKSEHPLAKAILAEAEKRCIAFPDTENFTALPGNGLTAELGGETLFGGKMAFMEQQVKVSPAVKKQANQLAQQGKTPLFFGKENALLGVIAVADTLKEDSADAVREMQGMGLKVVMLTGDNELTANAVGRQAGVDEVIAGVLPEGKEKAVRALKRQGKVIMVGDGVNDAPALTAADMGIAIGAGTDVALDAADVVLMKNRLTDVSAAIRLSRQVLKNIKQNLFWAFFYNVIGIPLAAGAFISLLGWEMNPMYGAAAMSLSSFFVVSNALRLNLVRIHDTSRDKKQKMPDPAPAIRRVMHLEGMMCGHCEATVKKALESVPGVREATVNHENGTALIELHFDVPDAALIAAVEKEEYPVLSVEKDE
ncbi:MAG: heavy metal translocating P-type ATPase [Clostridia bacterium]|nr:heavy metal translocating P-type ATPase [Clostridia bacterium]